MPALDVVLRRLIQRIRDALPGSHHGLAPHGASADLAQRPARPAGCRLRPLPPDPPAAPADDIQQKIAPKIVTLLFRIVTSGPGRFAGVVAVLGALYLLLKP